MNTRTVKCPNCREAASCEAANYIRVSKKDVEEVRKVKHIHFKETKGWSVWRSYFHAIHYPGISPALENIKSLPEKYTEEKWVKGFGTPDWKQQELNAVIRCSECGFLESVFHEWPNDAYFQVDYKGRVLWAYDRGTALKLLNYIESKGRIQEPFLRKLPEHFQTAKARPEISKKLRKVLDLPAKALT